MKLWQAVLIITALFIFFGLGMAMFFNQIGERQQARPTPAEPVGAIMIFPNGWQPVTYIGGDSGRFLCESEGVYRECLPVRMAGQ